METKNLEGQRFERWLVQSYEGSNHWSCICECGKIKLVAFNSLIKGLSKSCGCLSSELTKRRETTHGFSKTKEYKVWSSMKDRAYSYTSTNSHYYRDKGITVCQRWVDSFENFLEDMGKCPKGMTLERVNNNLNYCPENCVWDSPSRQASNRGKSSPNKSGRVGVYWSQDRDKWRVCIKVNKIRHYLGQYDSYDEACDVCKDSEKRLLGYTREDN